MTAERLEIIAVNGDKLGEVTLTSQGKERTLVGGDLLSEGIYSTSIDMMRRMVKLRARKEYRRKYEITRETINNSYSK